MGGLGWVATSGRDKLSCRPIPGGTTDGDDRPEINSYQ
jgi:hypothetical protein